MSYDKFLKMERPTFRGEKGIDPRTGWRWEERGIGMVRNAKPKDQKRMRVYIDPAPHVIVDQNVRLRGWYKSRVEKKGVRARPCYTEALLTSPYGGACPVRCTFCYINNGTRGYRSQAITTVDPRYPEKVAKQMSKIRTASAFYISSFTEPFQPGLEPVYHNTQRLAQVATRHRLPIFFLTRQVPPDWAVDELRKNPYSYQQFSINTPDPDQWNKLSPFAAKLDELLDAVEMVSKAGVYVSIQCNPIVAGITTIDQIVELIHKLARRGANHIIFKFVEIVSPAAKAMMEKMDHLFPDRAPIFRSLFTETIGHVRTVAESFRRDALKRINAETKKAGVTMGLCYEYGYERTADGTIKNKTGYSLGPEFTTADQCHGRRVPVFSRPVPNVPFESITVCKPSGCLYCFEAPCGNKTLGQAKALEPADLKKPAWTERHG